MKQQLAFYFSLSLTVFGSLLLTNCNVEVERDGITLPNIPDFSDWPEIPTYLTADSVEYNPSVVESDYVFVQQLSNGAQFLNWYDSNDGESKLVYQTPGPAKIGHFTWLNSGEKMLFTVTRDSIIDVREWEFGASNTSKMTQFKATFFRISPRGEYFLMSNNNDSPKLYSTRTQSQFDIQSLITQAVLPNLDSTYVLNRPGDGYYINPDLSWTSQGRLSVIQNIFYGERGASYKLPMLFDFSDTELILHSNRGLISAGAKVVHFDEQYLVQERYDYELENNRYVLSFSDNAEMETIIRSDDETLSMQFHYDENMILSYYERRLTSIDGVKRLRKSSFDEMNFINPFSNVKSVYDVDPLPNNGGFIGSIELHGLNFQIVHYDRNFTTPTLVSDTLYTYKHLSVKPK